MPLPRPRRVIRVALPVLSLLVCVAAAILWARSHQLFESYAWMDVPRRDYFQVGSRDGRLWLHRNARLPAGFVIAAGYARSDVAVGSTPGPSYLGFYASRSGPGEWTWGVPYWAVVLTAAVVPCAALARRVRADRRRRLSPGACPHCGYDLRATPDRCPECGRSPAVAVR